MEGSGIDGWSLGVKATYATTTATYILLGQSNAMTGDVIHEETKNGAGNVCELLAGNYSIVATGTGKNADTTTLDALYGFG